MNSKRRTVAKELIRDIDFTPRQAYLATRGLKGHRKALSDSSIWQKLKAIKRLGKQQESQETPNENPSNT